MNTAEIRAFISKNDINVPSDLTLDVIRVRIKRGMDAYKACTKEKRAKNQLHSGFGKSLTLKDWAALTGCNLSSLQTRVLNRGMGIEEAFLSKTHAANQHLAANQRLPIKIPYSKLVSNLGLK